MNVILNLGAMGKRGQIFKKIFFMLIFTFRFVFFPHLTSKFKPFPSKATILLIKIVSPYIINIYCIGC